MATISQWYCRCGNPVQDGQDRRPTCGIVICLANDAYERALIAAKPRPAARAALLAGQEEE